MEEKPTVEMLTWYAITSIKTRSLFCLSTGMVSSADSLVRPSSRLSLIKCIILSLLQYLSSGMHFTTLSMKKKNS